MKRDNVILMAAAAVVIVGAEDGICYVSTSPDRIAILSEADYATAF